MRLKIIAGNLLAVLVLGAVSYLVVGSDLRGQRASDLRSQISRDQQLLDRSLRYSALEFVARVKARASESDAAIVFRGLDDDSRRKRAFELAERSAAWFGDPARGGRGVPSIVVVVDDTGKVLARNADRNRLYGKDLSAEVPAVRLSLRDGEARHDVWFDSSNGTLMQVAASPINGAAGNRLGGMLVGYDISNGFAKAEGELLSRDVAFLVEGKVYSSTMSEAVAKQFKQALFGPLESESTQALAGQPSAPWTTVVGASRYLGVLASLPMAPSRQVAYAVMVNDTAALDAADSVVGIVLWLTVLMVILVLVYGFIVGSSILQPIEAIEEGVLAVINGNTDLRLDTDNSDLGGLAYRINQLMNVFTGVAESTDEQGRISSVHDAVWTDSAFADGSVPAPAAAGGATAAQSGANLANQPLDDAQVAQALAAEDEQAYQVRLFAEYCSAKTAAGEDVSGLPQERFLNRLQNMEKAASEKYQVRLVRHRVQTSGSQVILQPVLIR